MQQEKRGHHAISRSTQYREASDVCAGAMPTERALADDFEADRRINAYA